MYSWVPCTCLVLVEARGAFGFPGTLATDGGYGCFADVGVKPSACNH